MTLFGPDPRDPILRLVRGVARVTAQWHGALLEGLGHLPAGPALLVGNHGIYGLETLAFFYRLHEATGRFPVGLTDRVLFGSAPMRAVLRRCGGILGTPENALRLFDEGHLVVCYPGGSREVFKSPGGEYRLQWGRSTGFARLAIQAGIPVIPFAGLGVDDAWVNLGHLPAARALLGRYSVPVGVGLGPLPLPVPYRFRLGPALAPPAHERETPAFKDAVQRAVERLLRGEAPPSDAPATAAVAAVQ